LIGNLLDWSKIEAGKFEIHERVLDLSQIEVESLRLVRGQAENRGIELAANPEGTGILLYADETASNAIKFTSKGGSVWLGHTLEADGSLTLAVKDSGIGMTDDEIRQALECDRFR
jgi:two-component system, cell cycle sensor histidine kinase PleC